MANKQVSISITVATCVAGWYAEVSINGKPKDLGEAATLDQAGALVSKYLDALAKKNARVRATLKAVR